MVDVANVMGSRPDGWWRDRAGAARRLRARVSELASRGITIGQLPGEPLAEWSDLVEIPAKRIFRPHWVLVFEGKARAAAGAAEDESPLVRAVSADGPGDDEIVRQAGLWSAGAPCLVVTADRELRRRCELAGAQVIGPGWLIKLL